MIMRIYALLFLALCVFAPLSEARAAPDPVLEAMGHELERSHTDLVLQDHLRPYFLSYTVKDDDYRAIAGKMGAIFTRETTKRRQARSEVRVGSYDFDSSEDEDGGWLSDTNYQVDSVLPTEDAPSALRHALWLLTDQAYKHALSSHLKVKGATVFRAKKRERPSFSPAPAVTTLEPTPTLHFDELRWSEDARSLGRLLAAETRIEDHVVHVDATHVTRWYANTEGSRLRTHRTLYSISVTAWARAEDGVLLSHSYETYAPTEAQLPSSDALLEATGSMVSELLALADAPVLEPYTGPAIITSKASGVFFHEVLGHRLEGHRQDREDEGQTFADHLGREILPTFLTVVDDPTMTRLAKVPLNGAYSFDDEGVASSRVTLVDRGVLRGFLMGRRPVKGFKASNGHGRAQGIEVPVARMGNLVVEASEQLSDAELKRRLLQEVRRQGRPFGIIVRDMWGGSTNTSSYGYQAFKGEARLVVRVDAKTGEETLVRGVDVVGTPLASLGQIMAVGTSLDVFNGYCGAESGMVPVSSVAPPVLIRSLELQRTTTERSRAPILEAPTHDRTRSK